MTGTRIATHALVLGMLCAPVIAGAAGIVPDCEGGPTNCSFNDFVRLIQNVINFLLAIAIPIFAIIFMWAGFLMVSARDNAGQREKAKGMMWNGFIGFALALAAYLIINLLTTFFISTPASDVLQGSLQLSYEYV